MALIELQLHLPGDDLESWTDAFLGAGALSAGVEDLDGDTPDEVPVYGEPGLVPVQPAWRNNRVSVLLEDWVDPAAWLGEVAATLGREMPAIHARTRLDDRDWVRQTQAQFGPIRIGRLAIVPTWHEPPADAPDCVVRIDPGVAFGTGTHPTTRLCLAWISEHLRRGASVLDYGCGSGILSICAARLGAVGVIGVDVDGQAVAAARDNAQRNGADAQYTTPESLALDHARTFDLVVANILANPIVLLAPTLARRVGDSGDLLLSGILARQAAAVIDAYRRVDPRLELRVLGEDEGWVALAGTKSA